MTEVFHLCTCRKVVMPTYVSTPYELPWNQSVCIPFKKQTYSVDSKLTVCACNLSLLTTLHWLSYHRKWLLQNCMLLELSVVKLNVNVYCFRSHLIQESTATGAHFYSFPPSLTRTNWPRKTSVCYWRIKSRTIVIVFSPICLRVQYRLSPGRWLEMYERQISSNG